MINLIYIGEGQDGRYEDHVKKALIQIRHNQDGTEIRTSKLARSAGEDDHFEWFVLTPIQNKSKRLVQYIERLGIDQFGLPNLKNAQRGKKAPFRGEIPKESEQDILLFFIINMLVDMASLPVRKISASSRFVSLPETIDEKTLKNFRKILNDHRRTVPLDV